MIWPFITGMPVHPVVATQAEILDKIKEIFGDAESLENVLSEIDMTDPTETDRNHSRGRG